MKKYHFIVSVLCIALAIFYLKTDSILAGVSSIIGREVFLASVHANYLTGVFAVFIVAYLIKKQES